ncbi:hypothetical protein JVU11DRAFT_66 [Chiua virens]|nr:hypothetical protein JVU11DRAFT_66 [Chiua virens]
MVGTSRRAKTTAVTKTATYDDGATANSSAIMSSAPDASLSFIPFNPGPSLERVPDDVLHEILSHLPTLKETHVLFQHRKRPPVVSSDALVRTPVLRVLSHTSRLLRSRCIAMAWQRVEICSASLPAHQISFYRVIGQATRATVGVLNACPNLLPLIQTISVCFTRYQSAEIIPAFAACLAMLPNLTTIQVMHAHSKMTTSIKNGFEGKRFPLVRRILLPSSAHGIIKCCPNVEEVTCTEGDGSTIVGSLVKGKCCQVRVLKGIGTPIKRLAKLLPNLRHIRVMESWEIKQG